MIIILFLRGTHIELRGHFMSQVQFNSTDGRDEQVVFISPKPFRGLILCLLYRFTDVLIQPLVAHDAIIAFDVRVLLGLARLDVFKPDVALLSPSHQRATDIFQTVTPSE